MSTISIVIISYNRPQETIESIRNVMCEITHPSNTEIDLIVINNGSTKDYSTVEAYINEQQFALNYVNNPENLGVSGGRNLGIQHAQGEYIIFMDDDAIFKQQNVLEVLLQKYESYQSQNVNIIAFGIENFYDGEPDHPVKDLERYQQQEFLNNIFYGCGFAVKKEVFDEVGGFDSSFFYGMEEYDFCYRAINAGNKLLFTKAITVLHKVSPDGREPNAVKYARMFENKCLIAYRYLPWFYVISHFMMWGSFLFIKSKGNPKLLFRSTFSLFKKVKYNQRTPISSKALSYIRSVAGRLTY